MKRLAAVVAVGTVWVTPASAGEPLSAGDRACVAGLVRDLDAPAPKTRLRAARGLGAIGPPASEAVPKLAALVNVEDRELGRAAFRAILAVGPEQPGFGPSLVTRLGDPDPAKRVEALATLGRFFDEEEDGREGHNKVGGHPDGVAERALGRLGPDGRKVVPAVVGCLGSADPRVRRAAVEFVWDAGPVASAAVPALAAMFSDPDDEVRSLVGRALLAAGRDGDAVVPAFVRAMEAGNSAASGLEDRFDPARGRYHAGRPGRDVPALAEALRGKAPLTRKTAALCLWHLRDLADPALPALEALRGDPDPDPDVRVAASAVVLARRPADRPARAVLAGDLRRLTATPIGPEVLPLLGPDAAPAVPRLITEGLGYAGASGEPSSRARRALITLGPVAVPGLVAAARRVELDIHLRGQVVGILGEIGAGNPEALAAVVAALDDPDLVRSAAWSLSEVGPAAKGALPKLTPLLKSDDPATRFSAARAAWKVGGDPAPLLADYAKAAEDDKQVGRWEASTLVEVGKPALPLLTRAFKASPGIDSAAAIAAIEGNWATVGALMAAVMTEGDADARRDVARVFCDLQPGEPTPGKPCVDVLVRALGDPDPIVPTIAPTALARIDPANPALQAFLTRAWASTHDRGAADRLAECGTAAKGAVPALKASLTDPDPAVVDDAARALYAIDRDAVPVRLRPAAAAGPPSDFR